jgi:hypothetical protein
VCEQHSERNHESNPVTANKLNHRFLTRLFLCMVNSCHAAHSKAVLPSESAVAMFAPCKKSHFTACGVVQIPGDPKKNWKDVHMRDRHLVCRLVLLTPNR